MSDNDTVMDARGEKWVRHADGTWLTPDLYIDSLKRFASGEDVMMAYGEGIDALCEALAERDVEMAELREDRARLDYLETLSGVALRSGGYVLVRDDDAAPNVCAIHMDERSVEGRDIRATIDAARAAGENTP